MKRNMFWGLTALVLALVVNVAFAESKSKANVPFAFSVEQNSMEAGQYTITVSDRVMQIHNDSTNKTVAIIAQHEESAKPQNTRLVFHRYGDSYFLAEVWSATGQAGASGIELPTSKAEQETRAAYKDAGGATEVVSRNAVRQVKSAELSPGAPTAPGYFFARGWAPSKLQSLSG